MYRQGCNNEKASGGILVRNLLERMRGDHSLGESKLDVEGFVSGQEPDDLDDEWAGDMEMSGVIKGRDVAQLLGKQQRVLRRALEKLTSEKALALISNGRNKVSAGILKDAKFEARRFAAAYARDEFNRGAKIDDIDFSEDESGWSAKIDPIGEKISFVVEFGVTGMWL